MGGGLTVPKGGRYSRPPRPVNKRQEKRTYREHVKSLSTLDAATPLHTAKLFILKSKKRNFVYSPFKPAFHQNFYSVFTHRGRWRERVCSPIVTFHILRYHEVQTQSRVMQTDESERRRSASMLKSFIQTKGTPWRWRVSMVCCVDGLACARTEYLINLMEILIRGW